LLHENFDLVDFGEVTAENRERFIVAAHEADGLIGMGLKVPTEALRGAPLLKAIATISAGYDNFDVAELTANKIVLMNLFDPLTETTADQAFALLMATARRIPELDKRMRNGEWKRMATAEWFGLDIHGKTLGVVGLGRIGAAIARRGALGCGMRVLYTARTPKPAAETEFGAQRTDLIELLAESDFVCIAVPLNSETNHMIGARELSLMKKTAIIVNIARGRVIDENALVAALRNGVIHGAGLDVFEEEPLPVSSPLMQMDNVVLAPHVGSATQETRDAMARYAAESLIGYLRHGKTRNVVNPEALL
jgi:gluconate 2-dehydrogenase